MADKPATRLPRAELSKLLAQSVGLEKADALVVTKAKELQLGTDTFTSAQALAVLESIAAQPGLLGVTARFAKSRVHLRWEGRA